MMMESCFDDLEKYSERIAIIEKNGVVTSYEDLIEAGTLLTNGLTSRRVVFLICRNCMEAICGYIAFLRKKLVPVLVNDGIGEGLYRNLYKAYQPAYVFQPAGWQVYENSATLLKYKGYELIGTNNSGECEVYDELALLLTTSGSTGSPKLVRQSYKNINSNTAAIAEYLNIQKEDRAITTMPMSYTYGLSIINSHLYKGASIIVNDYTLMEKEFWNLLKQEKATTFGGVPYIYEMLKKLRFNRMELPSLRYLTQAGGKLSKELSAEYTENCENKNIKFIVMYGQTEATARMAYLPWESAKKKAGSMGIPIPGGQFLLIDDKGQQISEPEIVGELVYKGENVTLGYAEDIQDLARKDDNKGILYTGDMAKYDKDGFFYIVGRKKRFLKLFGNRVNLDEMEAILKTQSYECVCSGIDDKMIIYTMSKENHKEMIAYVSQETGLHPSAFEVRYIEAIPRNEAGKVLYSALN